MSVRVSSLIWDCSDSTGSNRLMLLAIADFADDDGWAFPSVATLARRCRMQRRNAIYTLAELEASGELEVKKKAGPFGVNLYRITLGENVQRSAPPVQQVAPQNHVQRSAPPVQPIVKTSATQCTTPVQRSAPEPSLNRNEPSVVGARAPRSPADRGSRLPENWTLPADWRAWAVQHRPDLDPDATADAFADYWHAAPGAKGRKVDWFATWRTWVRNQRTRPGAAPTAAPSATAPARRDTDYDFADEVAP